MKVRKNIIPSFMLLMALTVHGHAKDMTETSDLSDFNKVELNISADLKITIGNNYSITMTGDEERIKKTVLDVSGDTLKIKDKKRFGGWFRRDYDGHVSIKITMPDINSIEINGSGDAEVIGINNEEISLNINGSGDLYVTGKSEKVDIEINGSGDVEMDEVNGNDVDVEINGSGNVDFDGGVCDRLDIEVMGSGDIDAKDLVCEVVEIEIMGSGNSRVHATKRLTFDSSGSGKVDVFGKPEEIIDHTSNRDSKIRIR